VSRLPGPLMDTLLKLCVSLQATRGQLARVNLPPVFFINENQIKVKKSDTATQDPYCLHDRPSKNVVEKAMKLLRQAGGSKHCVDLGAFGRFGYRSLEVCAAYCRVAELQKRVEAEVAWLKNDPIKDLLLSMRPTEEFIRVGNIFMDAADFSNLACERYLDGYTRDISCLTFLATNKPKSGVIIYLPSYTPTWASCGVEFLKKKIDPFLPAKGSDNIVQVFLPVNVDKCHWGLLYVDVSQGGQLFYDDGLHLPPPKNIYLVLRNIMTVLKTVYPRCKALTTDNWVRTTYKEFGMPTQPSQGEGVSSCGIGVIFGARDLISQVGKRNTKMSWSFSNSSSLRKQIMRELILIREKQ